MEALSYDEIVVSNIRAARARLGIDQVVVVERMRALGFTSWHRQTMGKVERGDRRLLGAGEIMGLAAALETTIGGLMSPAADDGGVQFPSGDRISARSAGLSVLGYNDRSVTWDGEQPKVVPDKDDGTAHVVVRPSWLAAPSSVDPAFGEGRAPLITEENS
jgi:transcriptional regulator with XRE-family HTH domain